MSGRSLIRPVGEGQSTFLDAEPQIATRTEWADSIRYQTPFMLGFAYQKGWLPVAQDRWFKAIELEWERY